MAFSRYKQPSKDCQMVRTAASAAITAGDILSMNTSGFAARAATNDNFIIGIAIGTKGSGDATNDPVLVDILYPGDVVLADATVTAVAETDKGEDVDLVDFASVDVGASTNDDCTVVGQFGTSTTQCLVTFRRLMHGKTA